MGHCPMDLGFVTNLHLMDFVHNLTGNAGHPSRRSLDPFIRNNQMSKYVSLIFV